MKTQTFNLHTHTARCGHAEGLDEQYIHSAIDAGLTVLGFSDHIPLKELHLPACRMFYEHKDEYLSTMRELQKKYQDQIEIKVGYEVEYLEDHLEYLLEMRKECDYMILGQHCKFIGYEYDCYCNDQDVLEYTKQIEAALKHGLITYVAHPDYFMLGRRCFNEVCKEAAHRIAKVCLDNDVPLELNLNGFHYGKKQYLIEGSKPLIEERYAYPFREFWEIIALYGCKVAYGYDAHSPIALLEPNREQLANRIVSGLPLRFIKDITLR